MNDVKIKTDFEELLQLVSFKLGREEFGVDILRVREINKMMHITSVPNSPPYVEGVINLRGKIIPVIDLRSKLGMPKKEHDKHTRVVVVDIKEKTIGFIVDAVNEVLRIPANITETTPDLVSGINSEFINAVAKLEDRLLILINLEKTLTESDKKNISELTHKTKEGKNEMVL